MIGGGITNGCLFPLSTNQEDTDKKEETPQKKAATSEPVVEKPSSPAPPSTTPATVAEPPKPSAPPVATPKPSTPIGTPKPTSTPVVGRPTSTPIGAPSKPVGSVGTPSAVGAPKPAVPAGPIKPTVPTKREETKQEVSRRNFLKGLIVLGGVVAVGQFAALGPYLQGSVGISNVTSQVIYDLENGLPIHTTDVPENDWRTFVYPRTGNPNIDNDTFRQCVIVHMPKGFVAPANLSAKDPVSGDTFVALSRVCVHLWCLWSYVPGDKRAECPCHGSQYVPGGVPGSLGSTEPGIAVAGPASLQTPPNNQLPLITITIAADGTISATGIIGQIGCGQKC